jgi:ClpP class serine protease
MPAPNSPARKGPNGYRVVARGDRAEIYVYGTIGGDWFGEGVTAKQFADDLKALGAVKTIDVRINSEGGNVFTARRSIRCWSSTRRRSPCTSTAWRPRPPRSSRWPATRSRSPKAR